jgi:DNA primase
MDVVMLAQHDLPYAVATLGTATTTAHAERLFRLVPDVVFCFDGDDAGQKAAWRALENSLSVLRDGRQASFLFLSSGDDPDSLVQREGKSGFEALMARSLPLSEYFFQHLEAQVNMAHLDGRARLAELARPLINKLPDSDFRDLMGEQLKVLTGITRTRLESFSVHRSQPRKSPNLSRSPVRLAIALLLHEPSLAKQVNDQDFLAELEIPGLSLLLELVELIKNRPHINSAAALLSHFEETETGNVLNRLIQGRMLIDPGDYEKEFLGILVQLRRRYSPDKRLYEELIRKGGFEALSEQEKEKLLHSLKKHQHRS